MSMHKEQDNAALQEALTKHGLPTDCPCQLSDAFRLGWNAGQAAIVAGIPDLVWDKHPDEEEYYGGGQDETTGTSPYFVCAGGGGRFFVDYHRHKLRDSAGKVIWHNTAQAAIAAANTHYRETIAKAAGLG